MSTVAELLDKLHAAAQTIKGPGGTSAGAAVNGLSDPAADALADIARHYGIATTRIALTSGLPLTGGRLPLEHIGIAATRAGLKANVESRAPLSLEDHVLPVLVLLADGGLDILWALERDSTGSPVFALLSEPGNAGVKARLAASELASVADGRIVTVSLASGLDERGETAGPAIDAGWFLPAFTASRRIYGEAIAATVAINVLALAMPLFTMNVYDRVLPNSAIDSLWALAIGVVLATLFDFALKTLRSIHVDAASRRADVVLANLIYGRLLGARLPDRPISAGVRANTLREFETLREFFNSATLTAFGDLPFIVLFLAAIWAVSGPLVLIALAAVPIVVGAGWLTQRALATLSQSQFKQTAQKNAVVVETLVSLEAIKAAGAESWAASKWEGAVAEHVRTGLEIRHLSNLGLNIVQSSQSIIQVVMIIVGFYMVAAGQLTTGALVAATMLAGRVLGPIGQIAMLVAKLHQTRIAYDQLSQLISEPQERPDGARFLSKTKFDGSIAFESVTFAYDKDAPPALKELSFDIKPGERVGVIGGIGSGKTTLLKLVQALHKPTSGRVLIDGVTVGQIDPATLRANAGLMLQDTDLFHGTIRSNIALADPGAPDDVVLAAAHAAGALEWIGRLPLGFETPVRERGAGLSGGQRQSVALARALVRRPRIVLLDEPTSGMDGRSEMLVIQRMSSYLEGRTLIVVTHRPAMLELANRLIVLEGGKKLLDGPKLEVLEALRQHTVKPAATQGSEIKTRGRPS
ncbi:MAG: type I secretion system permease/ATPase [Hyphomicrobium sp.]